MMLAMICALCVAALIVVTVVLPLRGVYVRGIVIAEHWFQDRMMELGRKTPENEDLVFLAIDQPSRSLHEEDPVVVAASEPLTKMRGPWPWPRDVWAAVLERLCESGARLVILDLLFLMEGEGDAALKEALDRYRDRVVIGCNLEPWSADYEGTTQWSLSLPADSILAQGTRMDARVGYVNFWPDMDDRVRSVQLETSMDLLSGNEPRPDSAWYQSLSAAALRQLGKGDLIPAGPDPYYFRYTQMGRETYKPRSIYGIFWPSLWERNYGGGEFFKDKIVFVGPSAQEFHDVHPTAFGQMLGPHLHMNVLAAMLAGESYRRATTLHEVMLICGMGLVAWLIIAFVQSPLLRVAIFTGGVVLYLVLAVWDFDQWGTLLTGVGPMLSYGFTGFFCFGYDFVSKLQEELRLRRTLERYVSRDLAHQILDNREDYFSALGGTKKPMTILFSDIRGFTSITEEMDGAELVPQLNEFLGGMVEAVFSHHGTLDKFIGDAVMAVWGSVRSDGPKVDAHRAVAAAVEMEQRAATVNARFREEGKREFKIGLGLNHGVAIFGNIGSVERMDPTVIGDAVNLASRLEGLTKQYRCGIIISESVAELVRDDFVLQTVDRVRVVGKSAPVDVFCVLGTRGSRAEEEAGEWLGGYEEGIAAFRRRDFAVAAEKFRQVLEKRAGDYLAGLYLERSEVFAREEPEAEWDGVVAMESK